MERTAVREEEESGRAIRERESPLSLTVTSDPHQSLGQMGAEDGERRRSPPLRLAESLSWQRSSVFLSLLSAAENFPESTFGGTNESARPDRGGGNPKQHHHRRGQDSRLNVKHHEASCFLFHVFIGFSKISARDGFCPSSSLTGHTFGQ